MERYIQIAKDKARDFVENLSRPQEIHEMLATWALPKGSRVRSDPDQTPKINKLKNFWRIYGAETPVLQKLALITFSQPVSQSAAEQSFSSYKHIMPASRNSLSPETQFKCLFVYYNLRKVKGLYQYPNLYI